MFNEELPFEQRVEAASFIWSNYGDTGQKIVENWVEGMRLESESVIGRDQGAGVSPQAILEAVRKPTDVVPQEGGTYVFVGENASVVLNKGR